MGETAWSCDVARELLRIYKSKFIKSIKRIYLALPTRSWENTSQTVHSERTELTRFHRQQRLPTDQRRNIPFCLLRWPWLWRYKTISRFEWKYLKKCILGCGVQTALTRKTVRIRSQNLCFVWHMLGAKINNRIKCDQTSSKEDIAGRISQEISSINFRGGKINWNSGASHRVITLKSEIAI